MKRVALLPVVVVLFGVELASGFHLPAHAAGRLSNELHDVVHRAAKKRQASDPLTTPIEGGYSSALHVYSIYIYFSSFVHMYLTPKLVTGAHAFVAPNFNAGDQRGPCPGLNALANHGYISHNGVTTV